MWTEKRLLKALAMEFKEAIQHNKDEIEQSQREALDLLLRAKKKHTNEIMGKRNYAEACRKEIDNYVELINYMSRGDVKIPTIFGVSPVATATRVWNNDEDALVSDRISVVMHKAGGPDRFYGQDYGHKPVAGYFAMEAKMGDAFDNDSSKLATAYVRCLEQQREFNTALMTSHLVMYHFLRKQFVRIRGNQAVNFIRRFKGQIVVLGDDLNRPYLIRDIMIEKEKKTKKDKVTRCHLHLNRVDNGNSDSVTLNIGHRNTYYRDDRGKHMWNKNPAGFHPVICAEKAIFKRNFEKFIDGY